MGNSKKVIKNLRLVIKISILLFSFFYFIENFPFSPVETPYENF
jgi:hypothetical protein